MPAGLLLLGAASAHPRGRGWADAATGWLCAAGCVLAVIAVILGGAAVTLPVGPPGGLWLAVDGMSGIFLVLVLAVGAASAFGDPPGSAPLRPLVLGGMTLALMAADVFGLLAGWGLMAVAGWACLRPEAGRGWHDAAQLGATLAGPVCLMLAAALLVPTSGATDFAALRSLPPDGARGAAVLALTLLATAAQAVPGRGPATLGGAGPAVSAYVAARVLFDLCGAATPVWWGLPWLLTGGAASLAGGWRAGRAMTLDAVLHGVTVSGSGVAAAGLGVALAARGADLPPLAAFALGGVLLHLAGHAAARTALQLGAEAAAREGGSRRLDRLGGLARAMPGTAACVLLGAASAAALPPMLGFAGLWTVLQSVLAAPRIGGLALQVGFAALAAALAAGAALVAAALLRAIGLAFLGRPRTPRAAAARDGRGWTLAGAAGLGLGLGVFPAPVLALAAPGLRRLTGLDPDVRLLHLSPQAGAPGYVAAGVAVLLVAGIAAAGFALRGRAARPAAAWEDGFAPPPDWLPFGDPATQPDPQPWPWPR